MILELFMRSLIRFTYRPLCLVVTDPNQLKSAALKLGEEGIVITAGNMKVGPALALKEMVKELSSSIRLFQQYQVIIIFENKIVHIDTYNFRNILTVQCHKGRQGPR